MSDMEFQTVTSTTVLLFRKVEELIDVMKPEEYLLPEISHPPRGTTVIGEATDLMKHLWTLYVHLERKKEMGENELLLRAVHVAMGYEVGKVFNSFGYRFGLTYSWHIYTAG